MVWDRIYKQFLPNMVNAKKEVSPELQWEHRKETVNQPGK